MSKNSTIRQRKKGNSTSNDSDAGKTTTTKDNTTKDKTNVKYDMGCNHVEAGIEANAFLFALIFAAPFLSLLFAFVTSPEMAQQYPNVARNFAYESIMALLHNPRQTLQSVAVAGLSVRPTWKGAEFVLSFMGVALVLERMLPGKLQYGPETLTGHVPQYVDNGVAHCILYTILFWTGSNLGPLYPYLGVDPIYDFGIIYDVFPSALAFLNLFGMVFCVGLTLKGIYFPSTQDSGSSGSWVKDYLWGTELYPRVMGLDLKRFINCRFSMTFWQLAGLSFCYRSYTLHDAIDWGLAFSALSQYLYLFKFFLWEMGYMRSIDIIVDRAGFEIQWGCLVWVPGLYTLHSRFLVQYPSGYNFNAALSLFGLSMAGVLLNYLADRERDVFRANHGKVKIWGKDPQYITAKYTVVDQKTGKTTEKTSLLLASGFWGVARHFQYFFELTAAWSWCLLANPLQNGVVPLLYAAFLTYLLVDRANRDTKKCKAKYGKYYDEYCQLVPYKILPGIY